MFRFSRLAACSIYNSLVNRRELATTCLASADEQKAYRLLNALSYKYADAKDEITPSLVVANGVQNNYKITGNNLC